MTEKNLIEWLPELTVLAIQIFTQKSKHPYLALTITANQFEFSLFVSHPQTTIEHKIKNLQMDLKSI